MKSNWVITIDGPAGVGKSTVSKALAERLSCLYLDTGALYRAIAYQLLLEGINPADERLLGMFLETMDLRFDCSSHPARVLMNGEDVTDKIRTEEIGLTASTVSAIPRVRKALLPIQRKTAVGMGVVAEGRDMGTIVFPGAQVKFFLDATENERIKRRYNELSLRGETADYRKLAEGISVRDRQDRERAVAPLKADPDAVHIDTTVLSVSEVVDAMMEVIDNRMVMGAVDMLE